MRRDFVITARIVSAAVAITLAASCVYLPMESTREPIPRPAVEESTLTFGLSSAASLRNVSLNAASLPSEVHNIDYYIFDSGGNPVKHVIVTNPAAGESVTLKNGTYKLYALINMSGLGWFSSEASLKSSLSLLSGQSVQYPHMVGSVEFSVPLETIPTSPVTRTPALITLTRLTNSLSSGKDIEIAGFYLKNAPGDARLDLSSSYEPAIWHNAAGYKEETNIAPASDFSHPETLSSDEDYSFSPSFLCMPNKMDNEEYGEPFTPRATVFVIKGSIDGSTMYWTGLLPTLEHNWRYEISGEIKGPGQPDDDDPPGSEFSFNSVTLFPWSAMDASGEMIGQERLYIFDNVTLQNYIDSGQAVRMIGAEGEIYVLTASLVGLEEEAGEFIVVFSDGEIYILTAQQLSEWLSVNTDLEMEKI